MMSNFCKYIRMTLALVTLAGELLRVEGTLVVALAVPVNLTPPVLSVEQGHQVTQAMAAHSFNRGPQFRY